VKFGVKRIISPNSSPAIVNRIRLEHHPMIAGTEMARMIPVKQDTDELVLKSVNASILLESQPTKVTDRLYEW